MYVFSNYFKSFKSSVNGSFILYKEKKQNIAYMTITIIDFNFFNIISTKSKNKNF